MKIDVCSKIYCNEAILNITIGISHKAVSFYKTLNHLIVINLARLCKEMAIQIVVLRHVLRNGCKQMPPLVKFFSKICL